MTTEKHGTVRAAGATLFYRVRGTGPLLVILSGGDGDADAADALCDQLMDRYTVVTYDRRGLSRSKIDAPVEALTLSTHGDDVHRLLAALTPEPALVFANSIGALIGLDLVARHPEQVHRLVAHEPPAWDLLAQAERDHNARMQQDVEETFRREGPGPAFKKFAVLAEINFEDREPDVALRPPTPQRASNLSFFFAHDMPAVIRYRLDLQALKSSASRIVPAGGQSAPGRALHRTAAALADALGKTAVDFPGGHIGWLMRPKAFAGRLREVLV